MRDMSYYVRDLSVLVKRAEAEGLPMLVYLLNMALEHSHDVQRGTVNDGKARPSGKRPYKAPELKILHKRQRSAA